MGLDLGLRVYRGSTTMWVKVETISRVPNLRSFWSGGAHTHTRILNRVVLTFDIGFKSEV